MVQHHHQNAVVPQLNADHRVQDPMVVGICHSALRASTVVVVATFNPVVINVNVFRSDRTKSWCSHDCKHTLTRTTKRVTLGDERVNVVIQLRRAVLISRPMQNYSMALLAQGFFQRYALTADHVVLDLWSSKVFCLGYGMLDHALMRQI